MSEVNDPIIQLIEEYLSGEMEDVRREELTAWLDKKEENRLFFERLIQDGTWEQRWRQWEKIDTEAAIRRFDRCTYWTMEKEHINGGLPWSLWLHCYYWPSVFHFGS